MVNVNAKTPNKKRKSFGGNAQTGQTPTAAKPNDSVKTPGKPKFIATPGKGNKTPKPSPQQNNAKTPKATPGQKNTPFKNQKKNKRSSESENESTPPKKLKMFIGTSELEAPEVQGQPKPQGKKGKQKPEKAQTEGKATVKKRKGQFFHLKEKINSGDKEALKEIDLKIKAISERKDLTKTAKKKLKMLQNLRSAATGEKKEPQPPSLSKKRAERRKNVKVAKEGEDKQVKPGQQKQVKKAEVPKLGDDDDDSDSSESDYQVDAEITPDKIIMTTGDKDEAEDSSDEEEEEEEGSGEEEESDDEAEGVEGEEEDDSDEEGDSDEEEETVTKEQKGRRINVLYTQGGKKKGEEKKNEVKAKNFKLQAMRKQGQLAGSVKQSQKRSARRGNKKVNGSDS